MVAPTISTQAEEPKETNWLVALASEWKKLSLIQPGMVISKPLRHGAELRFRFDGKDFSLIVRRYGSLPLFGSSKWGAWQKELSTFRRDFGVPDSVEVEPLRSETEGVWYGAQFTWAAVRQERMI